MAKIAPFVFQQFFSNNGDVLAGGKIYTYEAGTTTLKDTYTDADGLAANTNPIILDANGRANIWLGDGAYKFIIKTSADVTIQTVDDIAGEASALFGSEFYTLTSNGVINAAYATSVVRCTNPLTLALLPASSAGAGFYFTVRNDSSGDVTIDPDGPELIDGDVTFTIGIGGSFLIYSNGTTWYTLYGPTIYAGSANTWTAQNTFTSGVEVQGAATLKGILSAPDKGVITIATGSATPTGAFFTIDTEASAASDDLDTLASPTDGQLSVFRAENTNRTVVVKHNTGNIYVQTANDISLDSTERVLFSVYDAALSKHFILADGTTKEYVDAKNQLLNALLLHIQDQKSTNTDGGGATSGSWQTRTLNTEVTDEIGSTLTSNEFTLPIGTYYIEASAPARSVNAHQCRLYNVTDAAVTLYGTSETATSASEVQTRSHIQGRFTIAGTKTFRIEHRVTTTQATNGYGEANGFGGTEIYTDVRIWKVS